VIFEFAVWKGKMTYTDWDVPVEPDGDEDKGTEKPEIQRKEDEKE